MKNGFDFRRYLSRDDNIGQLLLITLLIFGVMSVLSPDKFFTYYNFQSISFMFPELGLLSIAMMLTMLTGGIDLSVIGIANLSGILAGMFFSSVADPATFPGGSVGMVAAGVALALATGLVAGVVNGLLITRVKIIPILATIGTGQLFVGLALVLTGGPAIVGFPAGWVAIGSGTLFGLAAPFIIFIVVAVAIAFALSRTTFGTRLMLIGTNARAAKFAGLRSDRIVFYSYVLSGALASMAGILLSARTNAAKADYGTSYLLAAVLVAVLGGTNPSGGRGTVLGVSIAVVALMFLSSGFQMLHFSIHLIDFIWGIFLLLVIALNTWRERGKL